MSTDTWPSRARIVLMSTPALSRCVAVVCLRMVCGLTCFFCREATLRAATATCRSTTGAELIIVRIVIDQKFEPERAAIKRAVEFECKGHGYAAFNRLRENTSLNDPLASPD